MKFQRVVYFTFVFEILISEYTLLNYFTVFKGKALIDKFSVECSNWVDEGSYMERNLTRDLANGEPLTYLYETLTRRNRATGGNETIKTEVFRGGNVTLYLHQLPNFFLCFL